MIFKILMSVLVLLGAFILPRYLYIAERKGVHRRALVLKAVSSLCFTLLGIVAARYNGDKGFAAIIVIGLAIGAVGDVVMNLVPLCPQNHFIFYISGTIFFIGHVFYISALFRKVGHPVWAVFFSSVVAFSLLFALVRITKCGVLFRILSSCYIAAVSVFFALSLLALCYAPGSGRAIMLAGAALFLYSDFTLVMGKVGTIHPKWMTPGKYAYYPGQVLIALSLYMFL